MAASDGGGSGAGADETAQPPNSSNALPASKNRFDMMAFDKEITNPLCKACTERGHDGT